MLVKAYKSVGPGHRLVAEGKNLDHARTMAKDAIRCYLEGLKNAKEPIPVERETAQVKISVVAWAESNPSLDY